MSDIMGSHNLADDGTGSTQQDLHFYDNSTFDSYHGYSAPVATTQGFGSYLQSPQAGDRFPYDAINASNSIRGGQELQPYYHYGYENAGQLAAQFSDTHFPDNLHHIQQYDLQHSLLGQQSMSEFTYSLPGSFPQDSQHWEDGLRREVIANQRRPNSKGTVLSAATPAPARASIRARTRARVSFHTPLHTPVQTSIGSPTITTQPGQIYRDAPYAKLIYLALHSAPGHRMVLKDIYTWFEQHTDKTRPESKGWQNSIRHNLSMNIAFQKEETGDLANGGKRNYMWGLTRDALAKGSVESTTRFRKPVRKTTQPQPQPSYRVSKISTARTPRASMPQQYSLLPYDQYWSNANVRFSNKEDLGVSQALQPQHHKWSFQIPHDSPYSTYHTHSDELFPHDSSPFAYPPNGWDNTVVSPYFMGAPLTALSTQSTSYSKAEAARPNDSAAEQRVSPTPSMTSSASSYGCGDVIDEEKYHF